MGADHPISLEPADGVLPSVQNSEESWLEPDIPDSRRGARRIALHTLYWEASSPGEADVALSELAGRCGLSDGHTAFARQLVQTANERRNEFDELINATAAHWRTDRIARLDAIIIRLALVELLSIDDIPSAVSIDEAVELAKAYGSEQSYAFVNGVLDAVISTGDLSGQPDDGECTP